MHSSTFLLISVVLVGSITFAGGAFAEKKTLITDEVVTPVAGADNATTGSSHAAQQFVEHVNYARVSLALKNYAQAKEHIQEARNLVAALKDASAQQQLTHVESGRLMYKNEPNYHNYYFPIESGPLEIKKVSTGPFWAGTKGAAVTDAEIVYITLDLNNQKAEKNLDQATANINKKNYAAAQSNLADIINSVVKEDNAVALPVQKARDNLALAHGFIARKNYVGARYALGHAKDALNDMEKDDRYANRKESVIAMQQEVEHLQKDVQRNDPTLLDKADATIQKWWNDLKE